MNGKHLIFGEILKGFDILKEIEKFGSENGQTSKDNRIEQYYSQAGGDDVRDDLEHDWDQE